MDDKAFIHAFTQSGGDLPVYKPYGQRGDGFGDIFRGFSRWFLPLFSKGVGTFFGEVSRGQDEGKSFGEAAKQAIMPTAGAVLARAAAHRQTGSGRRRRHRKAKRKAITAVTRRRVYKGRGLRRKRKSTKRRGRPSAKTHKFNF